MKTKIILAMLIAATFVGCRKEDETPAPKVYPEENPLSAYIQNSGFSQKTTNYINSGTYEFGYKFKPKVKGNINAVTFKIPDNATNVRVSIWNESTRVLVSTFTIPTVSANVEVRNNITPLAVDPSTEYLITYNGNDWYERKKTDGSSTVYPIDAGNILITGYRWMSGAAQAFPTSTANYYYAGDLSIVFQQTE